MAQINRIILEKCTVDPAQDIIKAPFTYMNGEHQLEITDAGKHSVGLVKRNIKIHIKNRTQECEYYFGLASKVYRNN